MSFLTTLRCFAQQTNQPSINTNSLPSNNAWKAWREREKLWRVRLMKARLQKDYPSLSPAERTRREIGIKLYEDQECADYLEQVSSNFFKITCDGSSSPADTMIKVKFTLHQNGSISDVTISGNTNVPAASCLVQVVKNWPPFQKWPDKMSSIVGKDTWEMSCNFGFNMTPPSPN